MKKQLLSIVLIACLFLPQANLIGQEMDELFRVAMDYVRSHDPVRSFGNDLAALPEEMRDMHVVGFISAFPRTPVIGSDTVAGIYWYGQAEKVLITGDLQGGWSKPEELQKVTCGENTFFYISYTLPRDARLDYQLIVDGQYMTDPRNEKVTPSGFGPHSEIAMPGFYPDAARARYPGIPRGTVDSLEFTSKDPRILPRKIKVYLPAGYENLQGMPVLYVVDGLEALEWMNYRNVLDNLIAWERIRPVAAVFIPPVERGEEMMGLKYKAFQDVLCHEIVPLIDGKYPTDARATSRGITGISAGGYFALMTVLERNDIIACGAGQSPSIIDKVFTTLKENSGRLKKNKDVRIYFDMGRYDLPGGMLGRESFYELGEKLHREMIGMDIQHRYIAVNDGHEWASWRERLPVILLYFFGIQVPQP